MLLQLQSILLMTIICHYQTMANMFDKDEEPHVVHHHVAVPMKIIQRVPYQVPQPILVKQQPEVKTVEVPVKVPVAIPVKIPVKVPYPVYVKVPYPVKIPVYKSYGYEEYGHGGGGYGHEEYGHGGG